jgi:hypothetical protein
MGSSLLVSLIVFAAALYLVIGEARNPLRIVLFVAASLYLLLTLGVVHLAVRGLPTNELLAAVFAIVGAILFFRASAKFQVAAATSVTLVGAIGLLSALHILR